MHAYERTVKNSGHQKAANAHRMEEGHNAKAHIAVGVMQLGDTAERGVLFCSGERGTPLGRGQSFRRVEHQADVPIIIRRWPLIEGVASQIRKGKSVTLAIDTNELVLREAGFFDGGQNRFRGSGFIDNHNSFGIFDDVGDFGPDARQLKGVKMTPSSGMPNRGFAISSRLIAPRPSARRVPIQAPRDRRSVFRSLDAIRDR